MSSIRGTIGYADDSLNLLTGCLGPGAKGPCGYCWANGFAHRFGPAQYRSLPYPEASPALRIELVRRRLDGGAWDCFKADGPWPHGFWPTFYPDRLDKPKKRRKPTVYFVCDAGDLWQKWVPARIIQAALDMAEECRQHRFLFLTRYPARYGQFRLPGNCWAGTTYTGPADEQRIRDLPLTSHPNCWVSYEPALGPYPEMWAGGYIRWIAVGAQTGPGAVAPKPEWIRNLLDARDDMGPEGARLFFKDNLAWPDQRPREYPEGLVIG